MDDRVGAPAAAGRPSVRSLSVRARIVARVGDSFRTVVDLDAAPAEAEGPAGRTLGWLVREGVVAAERTDCALGAAWDYPPVRQWVKGHPPAQHWAKAVLAPEGRPAHGLDIRVGRTISWGGEGSVTCATCPVCGAQTDVCAHASALKRNAWGVFAEAIDLWRRTGAAAVGCAACGREVDLPGWHWSDDGLAFGYLGLTFWNWPPLDPRFVADLARALGGHRVVLHGGQQ